MHRPFDPRRLVFLLSVPVLLLSLLTSIPSADGIGGGQGEVALSLLLRKLETVGTVMHVTAHPDDENNGLLAKQSHGQGLRTVLVTATRGTGGQNEIGPELFDALGVLRTEELLAAHEHDGAEQFFARAVDFGYSFSVEETFEKWGKEEIVGDYVRLIRTLRPDVMIGLRPDLGGGGQHHQASALIALEAYRAAGDPSKYPEQLRAGLRPWQPKKIYMIGYFGFFRGEPKPPPDARLLDANTDVYDPLLGQTYAEIGSRARSMHKCQGFGQLLALPGSFTIRYKLAVSTIPGQVDRDERDFLDGLSLSFTDLAGFAGDQAPEALTDKLADIAAAVSSADQALRDDGPAAAVGPLAGGLTMTRALRKALNDGLVSPDAAFEIDFRLARTESLFSEALVAAQGLRIEALADDGVVTPGQTVKVRLIAANRAKTPSAVHSVSLEGFTPSATACTTGPLAGGEFLSCEEELTIPDGAAVTEPYWRRLDTAARYAFEEDAPFGRPFRPSPYRAVFELELGGARVRVDRPVVHRYEGNIFSGEKRMELLVVPALSARVSPDIAIVPTPRPGYRQTSSKGEGTPARTISVTVTNNDPGPRAADVTLAVPAGWTVEPASRAVRFDRQGEADTVSFRIQPPADLAAGVATVTASANAGGRRFATGYDVVEYPHIHRRHVFRPAEVTVKSFDVRVAPNLQVGYVMGVGDQVPEAMAQIGASVTLLDAAALASGDLSRFDAIVTGVRAYERREDLRAFNDRLIEYARQGGTVIVQYNKFEFNQAQYGPYPVKVSSGRVTDEEAPVRILVPDHPVFNVPNAIGEDAWGGWVQERGLYFLGERDDRYVDLLEMTDPFDQNPDPQRGALVEAKVGDGRWVYVGLGLFRQLPAGTVGAYRLLANLLSLGATEPQSH